MTSSKKNEILHKYKYSNNKNRLKMIKHNFTNEFLKALNEWQKGSWSNFEEKAAIGAELIKQCEAIHPEFKSVDQMCYRKRFIHIGELVHILIDENKNEGLSSWTIEEAFSYEFNGWNAEEKSAEAGALFKMMPLPEDVILNLASLWANDDFVDAAETYIERVKANGSYEADAEALDFFRDNEKEVILRSTLRGSGIQNISGKNTNSQEILSQQFLEICDSLGIPDEERDNIRELASQVDLNSLPLSVLYAPDIIKRSVEKYQNK